MKRILPIILFTLFSAACATTSSPINSSAERVDLLIVNGSVITMAGPNLQDGAVAVHAGKIVAVGTTAELKRRYQATDTIDATGQVVLPGFVNAHTHAPMTLFRGIADDRELMDWLRNFIFPAEAKNVDAEFVRWGTRLALAEMIASGTTTFADMYYFEAEIARETKKAGLRAVLGETMIDFPAPDNKTWDEAVNYVRRYAAEFQGDSLITPALAPHAPFTVSSDHLRQVRALATELKVPILIHVSETQDELRQVAEKAPGLTPPAYLESLGFLGADVLAAHGVWLTPEDIDLFARRGVGVVHNPESNMMLASGVAPVTAMLKAGLKLGLGTDGPAGSNNNLDMIEEMASAARLQKTYNKDPRAISARSVLEMATIGGARALNLDSRIGSLEQGKQADIILIDLSGAKTQPVYSLDSAVVYAASGSNVTTTIVDGKILMRKKELKTLDLPSILAAANRYRDSVLRSLQN